MHYFIIKGLGLHLINVLEIDTYNSFRIFQNFHLAIILLRLAYYLKIILRRYTCIRNTSFKIVESNEVKSLVLAANRKQGTIWQHY